MTHHRHTAVTILVIVAVAAVVGVGVSGLRRTTKAVTAKKQDDSVAEVRVTEARRDTVRSHREFAATVEPTRLARLASPAEGPIVRLLVREGDEVESGRQLVVIGRSRATQARLVSDREELRTVQDDFERIERLVAKGALPGELLDKAKADLERAKATVEAGEEAASDFEIRAPWRGVVSRVLVQEGNYVAPRTVLVEMFDPESLVLRLALPEAVSFKVQRGAEAHVQFDALPNDEVTGRVTRVYPELDRQLRMRTIEVSVDRVGALAPGLFARVRLLVEQVPDAVVIPAVAVVTTSAQESALFVVTDDLARQRVVRIGVAEGERVQIISGVAVGEKVVIGGHQKLRDGSPVRIKVGTGAAPGGRAQAEGAAGGAEGARP